MLIQKQKLWTPIFYRLNNRHRLYLKRWKLQQGYWNRREMFIDVNIHYNFICHRQIISVSRSTKNQEPDCESSATGIGKYLPGV
jgi:hypothetical protein